MADALNYLEAAERLWQATGEFSHLFQPIGMLLNHSVELSVKSYCLFCGYSVDRLREEFGHDLFRLYESAMENDLGRWLEVSPNDSAQLKHWNEANIRKHGRFPRRYAEFGEHPGNDKYIRGLARRMLEACFRKSVGDPNEVVNLGLTDFPVR
jgi:hypothetical protein